MLKKTFVEKNPAIRKLRTFATLKQTNTDRQTLTDTHTHKQTQTDRHRQKETKGQIIVNFCVLLPQIVRENLDFLQAWLEWPELIWSPDSGNP